MEKEKICKNCSYFVQHYTKVDGKYLKVYCGHCINLNNKENCGYKKANQTCENFNFKGGKKRKLS